MIISQEDYIAISYLPQNERITLISAIFDYEFGAVEPELNGTALAFWLILKPKFELKKKRIANGRKGGETSKNKQKTSQKQDIKDVEVKQIKSKTKTKTVEERAKDLYDKCLEYFYEYGAEMLREFYDYWTEIGDNQILMRFEREKTFELSKRLARWKSNNINKSKSITYERKQPISDEELSRAIATGYANAIGVNIHGGSG